MVNSLLVGCGQRIVWDISPGDPRYFTHVGRVVLIKLRWARPTKTPSHKCRAIICQGTRIGVDGKAD
jgi:hypothetical protein